MRVAVLTMIAASAWAQGSIPEVKGIVVEATPLRYIDVTVGTGPSAAPGQEYTVHYTGWLRDGTKFDSSRDRNEPFSFVQGRRQVIAGWETGFEGMKVGGKRRLMIPYALAYGERGSGPIPPKAELIFDVELLDAKDVPDRPAASDVLLALSDAERRVTGLANAISEDKFDWRPSPGVRSIREILIHIANGNRLLLEIATKQPPKDALQRLIQANAAGEKQALAKDKLIGMVSDSFTEVRKALEPARAGRLASDADFFGRATTFRGIFVILTAHVSEHAGQLIAYARINGIVPPWSDQ